MHMIIYCDSPPLILKILNTIKIKIQAAFMVLKLTGLLFELLSSLQVGGHHLQLEAVFYASQCCISLCLFNNVFALNTF